MTKKIELKPCPFCGGNVELHLSSFLGSDTQQEHWSIHCKCPVGSPDAIYDDPALLIAAWNARIMDARQ